MRKVHVSKEGRKEKRTVKGLTVIEGDYSTRRI